ncbi:MAG: hypothetical protein HY078_13855 [Elusimicrobia bacterium]|nr:hypothetical protein [Elusimicrobiota bacterium]
MKFSSLALVVAAAYCSPAWSRVEIPTSAAALQHAVQLAGDHAAPSIPLIPIAAKTAAADNKAILPVPVEGYYRTSTATTMHFVDATTRRKLPAQGPITRTGLNAKFGDGNTFYQFNFTKLYAEDSSAVLSLSEIVRTMGPGKDEFKEWRSYQSFSYSAGATELVKDPITTSNVLGKDVGNGALRYNDPTGDWGLGREAVQVSTKKVQANGDETQTVKTTNMNIFAGNAQVVVAHDLSYTAKVSTKEQLLGSFPTPVSDFLRKFADMHLEAVRLHKESDACNASVTPQTQAKCDELQAKYAAADKARHEFWETLNEQDLGQLVPTEPIPQD